MPPNSKHQLDELLKQKKAELKKLNQLLEKRESLPVSEQAQLFADKNSLEREIERLNFEIDMLDLALTND